MTTTVHDYESSNTQGYTSDENGIIPAASLSGAAANSVNATEMSGTIQAVEENPAVIYMLKGFFMKRGWSVSDAEDRVQDTIIRAWHAKSQFDPLHQDANLPSFLLQFARYTSMDATRKIQQKSSISAVALEKEVVERYADTTEPDCVDRMIELDTVAALLGQLDSDKRAVIQLVQQGFKQIEIAQQLNIPLGTVKTRTMRAYEQLRRHIQSETSTIVETDETIKASEHEIIMRSRQRFVRQANHIAASRRRANQSTNTPA